jgi:hypothetical protein
LGRPAMTNDAQDYFDALDRPPRFRIAERPVVILEALPIYPSELEYARAGHRDRLMHAGTSAAVWNRRVASLGPITANWPMT